MKKLLFFCFSICAVFIADAQKVLPEFGEISQADLRMTVCSFQPDAAAMNLFDVQEIKFGLNDYDSKMVTERRVRIKFFNEKGYKNATIRIPYFNKKRISKIKDLEGVVYNLAADGTVIVQKLQKKDFFKEKAEENVDIVNFTFPNLRPGSVIEFRYTKIERDITRIDPWIIQKEIPTAYAATILTTPSISRVKEKIVGADSISKKTDYWSKGLTNLTIRSYYIENVPAFQPEPFMSSYSDNQLKVIFLLIPEGNFITDTLISPEIVWKYTAQRLLRSASVGDQLKKIIPGTETLIDSAKKIKTINDRIRFIYQAVQKRAPVNAEQSMYPDDIIDAWNNKSGNTAEINIILINLLIRANIRCFPLLVSTRGHGKVNMDFPSTGQLNGIDVLAVDSQTVYVMDASIRLQSYQNPPINIMNRAALLVNPDDVKWVMINDERPLFRQSTEILSQILEDGNVKGSATLTYYDYAKSQELDTSHHEEEDDDRFIDKKAPGLKIISVKQDSLVGDTDPLQEHIEFTFEPQNSDQFYFINPQFLFFKDKNPFLSDTRHTDIDFGCNQRLSLSFQLNFPSEFQVEDLPKNIFIRAPDTSFFFRRIFSSDSSHIYLTQSLEINKSVFYREDYPAIQEFFKRAFALMRDEIILKKKK